MKLALNLVWTFGLMVLVLFGVALLGGVGTIELGIWLLLLLVAMAVVAKRTRREVTS
jgi:hypothetical protein